MRIAAQLYTTRYFGQLPDTLEMVAQCGYRDVETVDFHDLAPHDLARQLQNAGLQARSAQFDFEEFEARFEDILEVLDLMNCPIAVMPWIARDRRPVTPDDWERFADQLEIWADLLAASGKSLAYHNHDFDVVTASGYVPLQTILARDRILWQPDVGWLAVSLQEPAQFLRTYSAHIISAHIKDADPSGGVGDDRWRDLGEGKINWTEILGVLQASPCTDLFVEHDEPSDARATLDTGYRFLRTQLESGAA